MIIDNKIESLPPVTKILAIIPLGIGSLMVASQLFFMVVLGSFTLLFSMACVTVQERVKVDFAQKRIKRYYFILGLRLGKWKPLKDFSLVTLIPDKVQYNEVNYAIFKPRFLKISMFSFLESSVLINLKMKNERVVIAKGGYARMQGLALDIGEYTDKGVYDCVTENKVMIRGEKIKGNIANVKQ